MRKPRNQKPAITQLEHYFNNVYKEHIRLDASEQKMNNAIIRQLHFHLRDGLWKDPLFKQMYFNTFYGGSYYDGLKVSKPDEYDICFQLKLPGDVDVISGRLYGYAQVEVLSKNAASSLTDENNYLSVSAVNSWFQGIVNKAVENMSRKKNKLYKIISVKNSGPAMTIVVENIKREEVSIDFVPSFWFSSEFWPDNCIKEPEGMDLGFSVVPKTTKVEAVRNDRNFRLSFIEQERLLIKNKNFLKPAIKILKYLRDEETQTPLKSYYIKTVALWELKESTFPTNRMSTAFLYMLKRMQSFIEERDFPYYWNPNGFDLISDFTPECMENLANRLAKIIRNIEELNWDKMAEYFNM